MFNTFQSPGGTITHSVYLQRQQLNLVKVLMNCLTLLSRFRTNH